MASEYCCCCAKCFKRGTCVGNNWFSEMCTVDRANCPHISAHKIVNKLVEEGVDNDTSKSE